MQSLSHVQLFVTPKTAAHQASPSPGACANSCPLNWWCHPTISSCHPLLLLPSIFPSIRVLLPNSMSWKLSSVFSSKSFIVLVLTFICCIHFELVFVYKARVQIHFLACKFLTFVFCFILLFSKNVSLRNKNMKLPSLQSCCHPGFHGFWWEINYLSHYFFPIG